MLIIPFLYLAHDPTAQTLGVVAGIVLSSCRPANLFWKKTLNIELKNLKFIAKTLRHAFKFIAKLSMLIQANV